MKRYVKGSSLIIFLVLSIIDIIGIMLFAICFFIGLRMLMGITPLGEAEDLEVFESLFGPPLIFFFLFLFGISILIMIAEILLKLLFFIKAVKKESYEKYQALSVFSLAELIVNSVLIWIGMSIAVNLDGIYSAEEAIIEKGLLICFLVYVVMGVLTILDLIFSSVCVKEEKAKRAAYTQNYYQMRGGRMT